MKINELTLKRGEHLIINVPGGYVKLEVPENPYSITTTMYATGQSKFGTPKTIICLDQSNIAEGVLELG